MSTTSPTPSRLDRESCYRAVKARDRRFDGVFYTAVATTGIYCRPSCPARTPALGNITFHLSPASAQAAGYRACKRCLPDATPGSPDWDVAADVAGRAMRLISDGVVDREGVDGLAHRVGYTPRHLGRVLSAELGAGPLALARARRAQTARVLVETTDLACADIAFAAGFASVRQFNDTVREVYAATPTELRGGRRRGSAVRATGRTASIALRLAVRTPFAGTALLAFLAYHLVPGVEVAGPGWYARTLDLPHGPGTLRLTLQDELDPGRTAFVTATFELTDLRDTACAVERTRRLLDADCDPLSVADHFVGDTVIGPLSRACPGLRLPGQVDGDETAVRTVIGQQVSVTGARTVTGTIVAAHGQRVETSIPGLTHLFPRAEALAGVDPTTLPMPRARGRALVGPVHGAREPRDRPRPRHRPRRGACGDDRPHRHRALDGRLRRDARPGPPRRLPAHRHRGAQRLARPGSRPADHDLASRRVEPLALVRPAAPLEHPDAEHVRCPGRDLGRDRPDKGSLSMWTVLDSPIGELRLVEHHDALTAIEFSPFGVADGRVRGARDDAHPLLAEAVRQLTAYFARELKEFDLPLAAGGSQFQQRVWTELGVIGYGETATYGEIARRIGRTNAASRAVGLANGSNPIPIVVPCHRVIGANGTLTGYAGGVERKQVLLSLEQQALF